MLRFDLTVNSSCYCPFKSLSLNAASHHITTHHYHPSNSTSVFTQFVAFTTNVVRMMSIRDVAGTIATNAAAFSVIAALATAVI